MPWWLNVSLGAFAGSMITLAIMAVPVIRMYRDARKMFERATDKFQESMDAVDDGKRLAAEYVDAVKTRACREHCALARAADQAMSRSQFLQ